MQKAAIYSRKSKFTEKGESIENQVEMCKKYGSNLGISEFEIYEDEGFSAKNTDRPQFQKLLSDIKKYKFTHLICYRLDRISRNVADFSSTLEILNKYNVSFISIKEQFDTSTAMGRAMMNVSAVFAQLERETIAERIKDNLRELSKTGRWLGGPAPVGYKSIEVKNDESGKSRKKHILEINSSEKEIPILVYELFLKHKSFQKVSRILESQGIYSRKGSVFSRELVKQLINNPVYCVADTNVLNYLKDKGAEIFGTDKINGKYGLMPYNRRTDKGSFAPIQDWIVSVGEHAGIITSDKWIACQEIALGIRQKASNRTGTSQEALLSGLVVCSHCGSAMSPRVNRSSKHIYRYYTCNLRNKASSRCSNDSLDAYEAEETVIKSLMSLTKEKMIEQYEKIKSSKQVKSNNNNKILKLNKEIETNNNIVSSLITKIAYLDNDPNLIEPFKNEILKIKNKNKEIQENIEALKSKNNTILETNESIDEWISRLDTFKKFYDITEDFEDKKKLIRDLVKFISWNSETRYLDIVLIGSNKERPNPYNLPLSNSIRGNGSCRDDRNNGISTYGKRFYR